MQNSCLRDGLCNFQNALKRRSLCWERASAVGCHRFGMHATKARCQKHMFQISRNGSASNDEKLEEYNNRPRRMQVREVGKNQTVITRQDLKLIYRQYVLVTHCKNKTDSKPPEQSKHGFCRTKSEILCCPRRRRGRYTLTHLKLFVQE